LVRTPWALFLVSAIAGCTCRRNEPSSAPPPPDTAPTELAHDLELRRTALIAFGNAVPLPVSEEFSDEIPQAGPALERAAAQRPNHPLRIRVARDVPFAQLTRLMQAALANRVMAWELQIEDVTGTIRIVNVKPPSPTPRGECWARAWVGPDARVVVGVDLGSDASPNGMTGILVPPKQDRPQGNLVVEAVRRADARCEKGQLRIYSQASARVGPAFDVAYAFSTAEKPPKINDLVFAVPSIGSLDSPAEILK
jgi:hypothetical protein